MFGPLVDWLRRRVGDTADARTSADENGDQDGDDRGFAGSLLDASVNYAHGGDDGATATRELQEASEHAGELEAARDDRP